MNIDITKCFKSNLIDTCSIWNILSSPIIYSVLLDNNFSLSITKFVEYECLFKYRPQQNSKELNLRCLLEKELIKGKIKCHALTLEDLQDDFILENRKKIGIGELSSIAFAKKVSIAFLTDDQKARKLASNHIGKVNVQTTPLILGWLLFNNLISDGDIEPIIKSHNEHNRPLEKYFRYVHMESHRIKMQLNKSSKI